MVRAPCCEKVGLKKGAWTAEEDRKLKAYVEINGPGNWRDLPKKAGLLRCGKSCRFRWMNYLRPDVKRGNYSREEEETIIKLHELLGNRWSMIAASLPGRTDNEIKNVWYSHLKMRLKRNPTTQETNKPTVETPTCNAGALKEELPSVASPSNVPTIPISENSIYIQMHQQSSDDSSPISSNSLNCNTFMVDNYIDLSVTVDQLLQLQFSPVLLNGDSEGSTDPYDDDLRSFWLNLLMEAEG